MITALMIGDMSTVAQTAVDYGFALVLCIGLLLYIYRKQQKLDDKSDAREAQAHDRELDHRKYIEALKNEICENTRTTKEVVFEINHTIGNTNQKIADLGGDIKTIKNDVKAIKENTVEIRKGVQSFDDVFAVEEEKR